MIYVIDNENGSKQKIVIPDNAHIMTEEDSAYFQAKADEATAQRNKAVQIGNINEEIVGFKQQIAKLKRNLASTDYQALKHGDGFLTDDEYAPVKAQRQVWREEINLLELEILTKEAEIETLKA